MKRFSFPLERVRKWRSDQAELEEMRLEQLYTELHAIEANQKQLQEEADCSRRSVLGQQYVMAHELSSLEALRAYTAEQLRRLATRREAVAARVIEQKKRCLEARRRFQLLDGLRDKALISWTATRDKEQEELAAELFLAKRNRG